MAVRAIRIFGDPVLKTQSDPIKVIDDSIRSLVKDLEETTALPGRAGVAAPQIGVNLRAFAYNIQGEIGHLINPEIADATGQLQELDEGCLSLPELWAKTPRYPFVVVRGQLVDGTEVELKAEGLQAQVFQHEIDHLNGGLYIDRLEGEVRKQTLAALRASEWFSS
jgi:peptide deformylase